MKYLNIARNLPDPEELFSSDKYTYLTIKYNGFSISKYIMEIVSGKTDYNFLNIDQEQAYHCLMICYIWVNIEYFKEYIIKNKVFHDGLIHDPNPIERHYNIGQDPDDYRDHPYISRILMDLRKYHN